MGNHLFFNVLIDIELNNNLPAEVFPVITAEYFIGEDPGIGNGMPFSINPGTAVSGVAGVDVTGLASGSYIISVRTMDLAGHWSHTKTGAFNVQAVACAVPDVSFVPLIANPLVPTSFTNTSTDVLGGASFAWDFDGDGTTDSTDENPSYTFPSAGTYYVSLFIDNGTGCSNAGVQELVVGTLFNRHNGHRILRYFVLAKLFRFKAQLEPTSSGAMAK